MELRLIKLSDQPDAGIYNMLQEIPPFENGFVNPMHGNRSANSADGCKAAKPTQSKKGCWTAGRYPKAPIGSMTATGLSDTEKYVIF